MPQAAAFADWVGGPGQDDRPALVDYRRLAPTARASTEGTCCRCLPPWGAAEPGEQPLRLTPEYTYSGLAMDAYLWRDASPLHVPDPHSNELAPPLHRPGHRRPLGRRPADHRRLALGVYMHGCLSPDSSSSTRTHWWIGITVLLLFVPRILWRITHRPPAPLPMPAWQPKVAEAPITCSIC